MAIEIVCLPLYFPWLYGSLPEGTVPNIRKDTNENCISSVNVGKYTNETLQNKLKQLEWVGKVIEHVPITMLSPLVTSWFITPSNYGYDYHEP